jgi:exonuclease III
MQFLFLLSTLQIIGTCVSAGVSFVGAAKVSNPLSFCIQNCNSLNLTGLSSNFELKLMAIVESRADVIFLCDTRIISSQGISCELRIKNFLRDNKIRKYQAYLNSASNSRGTAILIANDLEYTIIREYRDPGENYHIAHVLINGTEYGIGAIYGPNHTSRDFYRNIDAVLGDLQANNVTNTVLGGDWNITWDRRPVISNIDTFQMSGLPNPKNSELLYNICTKHRLTDPFRALYPIRKEFTYSPFGHVRLNRSSLDFFVVSETLIPNI